MTHQDYFKKYKISIEQYGVFLVAQAFGGENTPHANKGFDIEKATIEGIPDCRIEVKSKVVEVHCNDNKFIAGGMTHLAVVLVNEDYSIAEAWLITSAHAQILRTDKTKSKYIPVKRMRELEKEKDIKNKLNNIAAQNLPSKI